MPIQHGRFFVEKNRRQTLNGLSQVARHAPREARPEAWSLGVSERWTSLMLHGEAFFHAAAWAAAISRELECVAIAFIAFEGTWGWDSFDRGHPIAARESHDLPAPALLGDIPQAAKQLGLPEWELRAYSMGDPCIGLRGDARSMRLRNALRNYRVRQPDEEPPWSDQGFRGLVRRVCPGTEERSQTTILELPSAEVIDLRWGRRRLDPERAQVTFFDPAAFRARWLQTS